MRVTKKVLDRRPVLVVPSQHLRRVRRWNPRIVNVETAAPAQPNLLRKGCLPHAPSSGGAALCPLTTLPPFCRRHFHAGAQGAPMRSSVTILDVTGPAALRRRCPRPQSSRSACSESRSDRDVLGPQSTLPQSVPAFPPLAPLRPREPRSAVPRPLNWARRGSSGDRRPEIDPSYSTRAGGSIHSGQTGRPPKLGDRAHNPTGRASGIADTSLGDQPAVGRPGFTLQRGRAGLSEAA